MLTPIREAQDRMHQPLVRLLGFIVLAAIVLATGFGAMGTAPMAVGGF
jgi:hypothetical protein